MIDKMKKLTFLVTNKEYEGFIASLRQMGVVHIQQLQQGATGPELQAALDQEKRYRDAIDYLEKKNAEASKKPAEERADAVDLPRYTAAELLEKIEEMQREELRLKLATDQAESAVVALEPWGEFDQAALASTLADADLKVSYWRTSGKFLKKEWQDEYFASIVSDYNKSLYFVAFASEQPDLQAELISLPAGKLSEWQQKARDLHAQQRHLKQEYRVIYEQQYDVLMAGVVAAKNEVSLQTVRLSDVALADNSVRMMLGWVKAEAAESLQKRLDESHIFYEIADPVFDDEVPISLTNGSFSRLFEPILKMYSLPNYSDIDPTAFFAPFFMLFFGLCMGDAGYGLLILLSGLYIALKGKASMRPYGRLACWLGGMTVVCGFATATFFGINLAQQDWAWIDPIRPYFLTTDGVGMIFGYEPMMILSVIIGLVQVLLGMLLKGCKLGRNYGWGYAIGPFAWFTALLAAIVMFGVPACGVALPGVVNIVLYAILVISCLGIFLYNNPSAYKNPVLGPLKNLAGGVWATYGMSTGLLGDLLSYIRLFALGLTGGVLGGVFNSLGYTMTQGLPAPANWLVMVIILLLGHGITFALSTISAFVHPMRLTFVEFFKNSEFTGGGKAFEPFRMHKS